MEYPNLCSAFHEDELLSASWRSKLDCSHGFLSAYHCQSPIPVTSALHRRIIRASSPAIHSWPNAVPDDTPDWRRHDFRSRRSFKHPPSGAPRTFLGRVNIRLGLSGNPVLAGWTYLCECTDARDLGGDRAAEWRSEPKVRSV